MSATMLVIFHSLHALHTELGLQGLVVCKDSNGHPERAIPPEMFCDEKFHCKNKADESSLLCPGKAVSHFQALPVPLPFTKRTACLKLTE